MARVSSIAVRDECASSNYFERGSALNRVLIEAPYLPRCSDNKTATKVRPREWAISQPYMQVNRPGMVSWLIFDLDHPDASIWEDAGLPAPNLIVRDRESGHAHLFYAIAPVCTTEKGRAKPIAFMKAVYEAMAARLQADPEYHSGPVAKTPGHPWWMTTELHAQEYELGKLAEFVDLVKLPAWSRGPDLAAVAHSRHCLLFEELRFYAYAIVGREKAQGSFDTFTRLLEAFAFNKNSFKKLGFAEDLQLSSIRATVKSVARWTWERYTGSGRCHRGVMQLDDGLSVGERQALAAERTHQLRRQAMESKIRAACRLLHDRGERLAQAAVARLAGVSRQTVAAYRHLLAEVVVPVLALATGQSCASKTVKYGAHQVTGAPGNAAKAGPVGYQFEGDPDGLPEPAS